MKLSTSRAVDAATIRIEGELDEVSTSDFDPPVKVSVAELQSRIVAGLSGSRLINSLDLGVGAVVFLYKKPKQSGGATAVHGLCDQPLAIVKLLRMEDQSAGSPQVQHLARGYLHLAVKKAKSQVVPVAGRLLNAENLPLTR
jgi:anti-sigma B factor antagonist